MEQEEIHGILCIDKPQGFTSFDVIAKLRGILHTKKLGHAGTLDPMATGVLPVFAGRATRACDLLPRQDKCYIAQLQLGLTTDTQDTTGVVLERREAACTRPQVEEAVKSFLGDRLQIPPMYSAIKVQGRKLYDLARQGMEVPREPRKVTFYEISLMWFDERRQIAQLNVHCSKGTYIRTLCHDIGQKLGCGAAMTALRRTEAAGFSISQCVSLAELETLAGAGRIGEILLPVQQAFSIYREIVLNARQSYYFENGVKLTVDQTEEKPQELFTVWGPERRFIGLGQLEPESKLLRVKKIFSERNQG